MAVLLLAEVSEGTLAQNVTAKAVTAAKAMRDVTVLVLGNRQAAQSAAEIDGIKQVLYVSEEAFANSMPEISADLLVSLASDYSHIVAPSTTTAKNILPRAAALLDVMIVSEVIEVIDANTFKRPIYAGNALQTVRSSDAKIVLTVRPSSYDASKLSGTAPISELPVERFEARSKQVESHMTVSERPELTSAKVVISGGRGLGSAENFELLEKLADQLNGAIGASRAAVDAGFAPNDWQVGQTGKVVAPELYIAVAISGAIQHLAGMKDSRIIVAINKDEEAPIFQVADYGLVADLFDVLPELTAKLS
ncbi:electron transfer flavoprotein subunit beta [Vibrio natriegens]|uniref:electron transfer flavoprotein subunit alpha/FixB family protein n=1 Tax=Vibrio natriegens TaxID=691 RepID=UPI000803C557|nr:FAD-binding protein [Vibrio natriegens]ANQ24694.1 electron transfer flavoprotein subunit beta [Vibrio natriegens]